VENKEIKMRVKIELEYGIILECDGMQSQVVQKIFEDGADIEIALDIEKEYQIALPPQKIKSITEIKE
jgi:hypothetical protein